MANNIVIALHAAAATIAMTLGAYNLIRRTKGDRIHRRAGVVWVVAMYYVIISSFVIKELRPGHFSWIHGLSVFTFGTLSVGVWAAVTHRVKLHRSFMIGSYCGLLGAFAGAVVVPVRRIPQWFLHDPAGLAAGAVASFLVAALAIVLIRRLPATRRRAPGADHPGADPGVDHPALTTRR